MIPTHVAIPLAIGSLALLLGTSTALALTDASDSSTGARFETHRLLVAAGEEQDQGSGSSSPTAPATGHQKGVTQESAPTPQPAQPGTGVTPENGMDTGQSGDTGSMPPETDHQKQVVDDEVDSGEKKNAEDHQ